LIAPIETPDIGLVQRLIDPRLIGAERAAALEHECDAVAALGPPAKIAAIREGDGGRSVHGADVLC
jgi:hypothetical protein